ncbi:WecB/TagA/CpsF family glycosyltransferase [Rhodobacter sp. SGA-6-6]|uniref:WecB/TagA/CpsF family glycosyltransferase n=1 Tax=Rhodobacter sp. SGA-6-6 TaxID=2710882 RepID=UPI0013ED4100|nr:WecB/TagA/CpsF family glycosyltransferase [Rhodobacter sp. SGA-6-6]
MQFRFQTTTIRITHPDAPSVLAEVAARLAAGRGFALATVNLDHLVKLRRDPAFRAAYAAQDLVVADGNPIVWLSRLAGRPVRLVPGSDLVLPLVRAAAAAGRPLSLLGSTEAALEAAMARLQAEVPGLRRGLLIAPPMGFDPEGEAAQDMLARLETLGPGLCLIALGAPKQERLAALGRRLAHAVGFASVGAGVDFVAGTQTRAPAWVRAIAMEWLWRALSAPRRMVPRYAACAAILPGQAVQALAARLRRSSRDPA